MLVRLALAAALCVGCATTKSAAPKRTLPEPLAAAKLPERPDAKAIPPSADWAIPVAEGEVVPAGRSGILLSQEKATRAARYLIGYNELRALYEVDLRTWGRERQVYERYVQLAQDEADRQAKLAERSWWERHSPEIALGLGVVVGAAVTVGIVAAVEEVSGP